MATTQLLSLVISAVDRASSIVGKVGAGIQGIGDRAGQARTGTENLSNAIAFGMAKAQLAIGAVQMAYGQLQGKFAEVGRIELENLSTASGLDAMVGGFDKAAEVVDRLNSTLAKNAAALPGATSDYTALARTISDDVAGAFKNANGQISNLQGFEDTVASLSTSYGAMAAASGVSGGNMQLFLMKALGGTASQAELMQIDALQKNAQLRSALDDALKKAGATSLKDLNTEKRIKLLDEVGKKVITPEFLARSQNTVEGMWQSFISSLFDPMGGVFGLMRDLEPNIKGQQTAFESLKKTMSLVIGSGGLVEQIGGIMAGLGLTVDPMRILRDGVDKLNGILEFVNRFVGSIKQGLGEGYGNFSDLVGSKLRVLRSDILGYFDRLFGFDVGNFGQVGENLGFMAARWLNGVISSLASIDYGAVLGMAGAAIARGLNFVLETIFGFLAGLDYGQLAGLASNLAGGIVKGIFGFLTNLDWKVYAVAAGVTIAAALLPGIATFAAGLVATVIAGVAGAPVLLIAAGVFVVASLAKLVADNWGNILSAIGTAVEGVKAFLVGIWDGVKSKFMELFAFIGGVIDAAKNALMNNPVVKAAMGAAGMVAGGAGVIAGGVAAVSPAIAAAVAPKYLGHVPNAAGGLMSAAVAESKAMPTGAQVVVANDREFILKPTGRSAGGGGNIFNFTISGTNAQEIADEVIARIQGAFEAELNSQLV